MDNLRPVARTTLMPLRTALEMASSVRGVSFDRLFRIVPSISKASSLYSTIRYPSLQPNGDLITVHKLDAFSQFGMEVWVVPRGIAHLPQKVYTPAKRKDQIALING